MVSIAPNAAEVLDADTVDVSWTASDLDGVPGSGAQLDLRAGDRSAASVLSQEFG